MTNLAALGESPDQLWQRWLEWAQEQGRTLTADHGFAATRARVWEASDYVAQAAARHPGEFAALLDSGDLDRPYGRGDLAARLAAALADCPDEPALHRALRVARRRELTRIIWRDLGDLAALAETLEDLSELADCCIREALDHLQAWTRAELGTPLDAEGRTQRLLVIGMGKLGARELNLSSDIDLIFAFPAAGQAVGGPRDLEQRAILHPPGPAPGPGPGQPDRRRLRLPGRYPPAPLRRRRPPGHELSTPWRTTTSPRPGSGSATP